MGILTALGSARAAAPNYRQVIQPEAPRLQELGAELKQAPSEPRPAETAPRPATPAPGSATPPPGSATPAPDSATPAPAKARRCAERDERSPCARLEDPAARERCLDDFTRFSRPTAVVVSGGVSLGSHQGGLLYYLSQFLRSYSAHVRGSLAIPDATIPTGDIRVATGASAGSINAFISAMASCRDAVDRPDESLFFRTWIPVGMDGLDRKRDVTSTSVLSRAPIEAAICRLRGLWEPGYRNGCDEEDLSHPLQGRWSEHACRGRVAFDVTRVVARDIPLPFASGGGALTAKRQTEQFILEYRKERGRDRAPVFFPVVPPDDAMRSLYPVLGSGAPDQAIALDDVFQLIKASSSFPVAFEPVPVPHQLYAPDPQAPGQPRLLPVDRDSLFIDGGVFDNTPLGVALTVSDWTCEDPYYVFVEPDAIGWQEAPGPPGGKQKPDETVFGIYGPFISDFITVSRQAELLNAIGSHEEIRGKLQVPPRMLPTASGQILNFLGFFERDFRRFDFYLGMTDSWDYLKKASAAASRGQSGNRQYGVLADSQALPTVADPVFRCFTALRAGEPADFHLQPPPDPSAVPACQAVLATEKNLMALYRTSRDLRAYTQTPGWQEARVRGQFFALLGKYDFQFKDLTRGGRPVTADEAEAAVRARMQGLAHRLALAQPGFLSSGAVAVAGKAALNSIRYRTPPVALEVDATINGAGLGGALLLSSQDGWRAELGASIEPWRLRQLETAPGEPASWVMDSAVDLLFGKEWALGSHDAPPSGRWQLSAAVGADARVITANRDFFPYLVPSEELLWRVGATARLRATFYQRLTLGIAATFWPDHCAGNNLCFQAADRAAQLFPIVPDRFRLGIFIGWRFLDVGAY